MIKKAVILCGGRGTRFLPVTKAVAKEMLPIIDTPAVEYIVDEIRRSGITEIQIVVSPGKEEIKKYFSPDAQLEDALYKAGKVNTISRLKAIADGVEITFACQEKPNGTADALAKAREFVGNEPFALCLGDDITVAKEPVIKQLLGAYQSVDRAIIGVQKVLTEDITKYGVIEPAKIDGRLIKCNRIVEKPSIEQLPSRYASMGRYIITPDFFDALPRIFAGANGEIGLPDALNIMSERGLYAYEFEGKRYDMGNKFQATKAIVDCALESEFGNEFKEYLRRIII